jgi:hypothetical protein
MQNFIVSMLVYFTKRLIDGEVFDHIHHLVVSAANMDIPGDEKRKAVLLSLRDIGNDMLPALAATAGWVVNLAIEVAVAKIKAQA